MLRVVRRGQTRCRNLAGDRRGSVSVEFAFAAIPFFMLVMGILEVGIMILQETVMYGALQEGARKLRTGSIQLSSTDKAKQKENFQTAVCDNLLAMLSCDDISYDVRHFKSYEDVQLDNLTIGDDGMPENTSFDPGDPGDITTIRIYSRYTFVTPFLDVLFNDNESGHLLTYTAIVKGEPWIAGGNQGGNQGGN